MARKLPWAVSTNTNEREAIAKSPVKPRPTKRLKATSNSEEREREQSSSPEGERSTRRDSPSPPAKGDRHVRARDGRSISTSPPPAPPPVALMRPGLDEDDIYMLVEDEFQAIAQSYTAHLHHAEYKRLMTLARGRKAEQQRTGTNKLGTEKIPKYVSGDARQQIKRKLLSERQSSGVKDMTGRGLLDDTDGEDEDDEDEAREAVLTREEKKVGDMWAGTALGGLMSWDHSQERPSLKGLERLGGETRASKGFGPSTGERRNKMSNTDKRSREAEESTSTDLKVSTVSERRQSPDSRPMATKRRTQKIHERQDSTRKKLSSPPRDQINMGKHKGKTKAIEPTKPRYRSFIDSLDDFDDAAFDATRAAKSSESPDKATSRFSPRSSKKRKDMKDRLDEVPIFLG